MPGEYTHDNVIAVSFPEEANAYSYSDLERQKIQARQTSQIVGGPETVARGLRDLVVGAESAPSQSEAEREREGDVWRTNKRTHSSSEVSMDHPSS